MKRLVLCIAAMFFLFSVGANAITIEGGASAWRESPTGWIEYKKGNIKHSGVGIATHIDLKNDLNFSTKTRPFGWIAIKGIPILPDIKVRYTQMKFTGVGKPSVKFTFGDIAVNVKDKVASELKANQFDVTLTYRVPFLYTASRGVINLDWGTNVKIIKGYAKVKDLTTGLEDSKSKTIPIPMIHLDGSIKPIKALEFGFSGDWVGYRGNQLYDMNGELRVYPIKNLFLGVGYRFQRLKIDDISGLSSNIKFKGVFAEAGFKF